MQLHGWQGQFFGNVSILEFASLVDGLAFHPFGGQRAGRNCRSAAECLELSVDNFSVLVDLDLQFHDVAAGWCAHQARADRHVLLIQRADVARVLVVLQNLRRAKSNM